MSKLRPHHDALFRATFGRREHALGLLQHWVPADVRDAVDWDSLELVDPSGFDGDLGPHYSDLVYSVELRYPPPGSVPPEHAASLYVQGRPRKLLFLMLIEHQSTPDRFIVWRLLHYGCGLQKRYLKDPEYGELPLVVPLLISNARRAWPYPLDLHSAYPSELQAFPNIWPHVAQMEIILDDLPATTAAELVARKLTDMARATLCLLRGAPVFKRLVASFSVIFRLMTRVREQDPEGHRLLAGYLGSATTPEQIDELRVIIRGEAPDMEQELVSALDYYRAEGEAKGRVEGRVEGEAKGRVEGEAKGRAEVLQRQLRLKFGELPEWALQRLQSASVEQLDSYAERILTAESLEATLKA